MNIFSVITYYSVGLNSKYSYNFYVYIGSQILMAYYASMYAFFIASFVKTEQALAPASIVRFLFI